MLVKPNGHFWMNTIQINFNRYINIHFVGFYLVPMFSSVSDTGEVCFDPNMEKLKCTCITCQAYKNVKYIEHPIGLNQT